jgi:Tfp pilus assembly protein PilV
MSALHRGWVLWDALLALCVLGVGVWGLFLSAAQALQEQRESSAWAQAVHLSDDLIARIAINREGLSAYQLALGETPASLDCSSTACNATQWAQADVARWKRRVQTELPQGDAQLLTTGTDPWQRLVWLTWTAPASSTWMPSPAGVLVPPCASGKRCHALWVLP